ncbi:right-handed parallel beta-helix repeat-containing protein, partial [Klebsiella pneumoniae]|uniref:right-handed parallel beta-helix repeat-containing protein n=1 Tax=Klebsiella pneumoniae TaxID=573 RepID=UPI002E198A44|nr:right-handed parallel beta-helix repeat-containing protein [Klebsiella pneumoniae]
MSTYKTKNPLGSAAVKDLYDNAENVDKFVNDRTKEELEDRLGVLRKTWHGMEMIFSRFIDYITGRGERAVAAIGWQELGNWAVGLAVDNRQQIVYYNGSWYKYLGELEHVIAGDSPENDGGVWSAANPTGKWSNIGDAALRSNLGSDEADLGGALVSIDNATMRELAENNIFRKMTRADINTMLNTPGAEVDVEYALQVLIDEGHKSILFPHDVKGIYILAGNVTVPAPVTLISFSPCVKPYTITDDSSFLNKGAVIRKAAGADYIFGPGTVPRFYGLLLDGRDSSRPLFNQENQQRGGILFNCGIYRFLYGIGSYSYTSVQVGMSSICANQDGVYNLIDSRLINCTINANTRHGVYLRNGANNNLFQNIRNEWNGGVGYLSDGSVGNIINGELVDRNGSANFAVLNGGGFLIGDVFSQRPGRTSAAGSSYNTHFYMEGAGSYIMLSNVVTRTGVDDDGQGTLTPERVLTTGGGSTDMTFMANGCDLSGYTISALRQITTAEKMIFRGNKGVPDLITTGLYQFQNGRGNVGGVKSNQVLTSGVGSMLALSFQETGLADPTTAQATLPLCRTLLIESLTSGGVSGKFKLPFQIRRVVQAANVDLYTSEARS